MARGNTAISSDVEEEEDVLPEDGLISKSQGAATESNQVQQNQEDSDLEEDKPSQWVAFSNPTPIIVKARFNITEIEVPSATEPGEVREKPEEDDNFLQMLIEEGIPVNYLSEVEPSNEPSNVGVILDPSDPIAEETLNLVPQSLDIKTDSDEGPTNQVDNIVEVTGCSKPISTPLFLHLVPSLGSLQEGVINTGTPENKRRRGSVDPSIIMLPPEMNTLPVKKKVRFDLPGRKASLIGEYEILHMPVRSYGKRLKPKDRFKSHHKHRRNHTSEESSENDDDERPVRRGKKKKRHLRASRDMAESSGSEFERCEVKPNQSNGYRDAERPDENDDLSEDELGESTESGEYEDDNYCGIRSFTPKWLQIFARNECYLIVFCLANLAQGMFCSYNKIILSTFQKRFNTTTTQAGFILSGDNIAQMIISVFVAFYGTYANRPKLLGIAAMCSAFAATLAASPHLLYGSGEFAAQVVQDPDDAKIPDWWKQKMRMRKLELCNTGNLFPEHCPPVNGTFASSETFIIPPTLLFSSQLLMGFANSVFWTVGVSYLDDNISKKKTSLHIAIFMIARLVGPRLGVSIATFCLSFWIDPSQSMKISPKHPKWIGAWWIGFFLFSFLIALPGFLYFWFPKTMRRKDKGVYYMRTPLNSLKDGHNSLCQSKSASFEDVSDKGVLFRLPCFGELPRSMKRLFTNKIWTANLFSNVFFALAMSNYFTFKSKYVQIQFRKSPYSVGFYSGMTSTIATVVGISLSGVVMRWCRPRTRYVTAYNVFLSIYAIVSLFVLMTIHCPSHEVAGHLPGQENWECSKHCSCSDTFSPICANDGVTTFYSPCFAGCSEVNIHVTPAVFVNCTCFGKQKWKDYLDEEERPSVPIIEGWAVDGFCPSKCNALTTYLAIQLLNKAVFATGRIGGTLINLRSVADRDKTLALGCLMMFVTFAGFIPTSIVLGSAIDSSCLAWNTNCGKQGSCSFYDVNKFRLVLHAIPVALLVLSCIGDLIVHMNNSWLDIYGEPPERPEHPDDQVTTRKKLLKLNQKKTTT